MIDLGEIMLRPLDTSDVEALYHFRNDPSITSQLGGFSSGYSRRDLEDWMESHGKRTDEVLWAIALSETDECIGHVGLYRINHRIGTSELAIVIGSSQYQGRGLGKAVTQRMIRYGFDELRLNKISLSVLSTNKRASQLYESLGFEVEGVLKNEQFRNGKYVDVILMALFASNSPGYTVS